MVCVCVQCAARCDSGGTGVCSTIQFLLNNINKRNNVVSGKMEEAKIRWRKVTETLSCVCVCVCAFSQYVRYRVVQSNERRQRRQRRQRTNMVTMTMTMMMATRCTFLKYDCSCLEKWYKVLMILSFFWFCYSTLVSLYTKVGLKLSVRIIRDLCERQFGFW